MLKEYWKVMHMKSKELFAIKPNGKDLKHLKKWLESMEKGKDETSKSVIKLLKSYEYKCANCHQIFTFEEVKEHVLIHGDEYELVSPNPSSRR